jgi:Fe-S cluster assembly iron-binding protein IscA
VSNATVAQVSLMRSRYIHRRNTILPPSDHFRRDESGLFPGNGAAQLCAGKETAPMFDVTRTAVDRLAEKLDDRNVEDDVTMRFVRRPGGWQLRLDRAKTGDVVFAREGRTVLVIDTEAARRLTNRTLDAKVGSEGTRLFLRK